LIWFSNNRYYISNDCKSTEIIYTNGIVNEKCLLVDFTSSVKFEYPILTAWLASAVCQGDSGESQEAITTCTAVDYSGYDSNTYIIMSLLNAYDDDDHLETVGGLGGLVGIIIGGFVLIVLIIGGLYCWRRIMLSRAQEVEMRRSLV
jgi:hypothetical protein